MPEEECHVQDQPTRADSHAGTSYEAHREAAPIAAARDERTKVMEGALATTLAMILDRVVLTDQARERITELMAGLDSNAH